jgi:glycosyltransferase involved in cell wall biosynthesis
VNDEIRISVALVTRDRPDSLRRCLQSLRAQGEQPWEVVVSDDSGEERREAMRKVAEEFGCRWVAGPRRGLYANRNSAARECAGTHIRTMDDDHPFPAGHFSQCLDAVKSDPGAVWTTGEIGFIDGKIYDKVETASQLHPSGAGGPVHDLDDNWAIADGSSIYPTEIFSRGLSMVEDFPYGAAYLEFGAYIYRHGYRSRCVRGAAVEHHAIRETLTRDLAESRFFASLCFNLYFRRSLARAAKYFISHGMRRPGILKEFPALLGKARDRWGSIP